MNPKIQKLRAELDKNNEKISKLQSRNTEIIQENSSGTSGGWTSYAERLLLTQNRNNIRRHRSAD